MEIFIYHIHGFAKVIHFTGNKRVIETEITRYSTLVKQAECMLIVIIGEVFSDSVYLIRILMDLEYLPAQEKQFESPSTHGSSAGSLMLYLKLN